MHNHWNLALWMVLFGRLAPWFGQNMLIRDFRNSSNIHTLRKERNIVGPISVNVDKEEAIVR